MRKPQLDIQAHELMHNIPELQFGDWPLHELIEAIDDAEIDETERVKWVVASLLKQSFGSINAVQQTINGVGAQEYEKSLNRIFSKDQPKNFYGSSEAVAVGLDNDVEDFLSSNDEVMVIALDGASGAGKTQIVDGITQLMESRNGGVDFHRVHADNWQGTERKSTGRIIMNCSLELFNHLFYRRNKFYGDIMQYVDAEPGDEFLLQELYDGDAGTFSKTDDPKTKFQNHKKRILLVEGYDAINLVNALNGTPKLRIHRLLNIKDPAQCLVEAVLDRDVPHGAEPHARFYMRFKESLHQYWQILHNMADAQSIFCDINWLRHFITERLGNYSEYVSEVNKAIDDFYNEFLPNQRSGAFQPDRRPDEHIPLLTHFMNNTLQRIQQIMIAE